MYHQERIILLTIGSIDANNAIIKKGYVSLLRVMLWWLLITLAKASGSNAAFIGILPLNPLKVSCLAQVVFYLIKLVSKAFLGLVNFLVLVTSSHNGSLFKICA
ncbi:hypothetical protein R6Q57_026899 [Mikania cordata]